MLSLMGMGWSPPLRGTQGGVPRQTTVCLGGAGVGIPPLRGAQGGVPAATETAFKALASQFAILHLAAHAQLNLTNPLFSRILLTPDDQNDGALEVHEIYELDLPHTDLVVLSACETILGKQSRGDDIIGLTRAFMYAGAPSVIASLWKVDDLATYEFMTAFYEQLQHGKGKAEALRNAQQLTRQTYPHPYYWAAFMLTGDPGTMPE